MKNQSIRKLMVALAFSISSASSLPVFAISFQLSGAITARDYQVNIGQTSFSKDGQKYSGSLNWVIYDDAHGDICTLESSPKVDFVNAGIGSPIKVKIAYLIVGGTLDCIFNGSKKVGIRMVAFHSQNPKGSRISSFTITDQIGRVLFAHGGENAPLTVLTIR